MQQERFAIAIRSAGAELSKAEEQLAIAEATEKRTISTAMFKAQTEKGAKTSAAQMAHADSNCKVFKARVARGVAKGAVAAAKANLLAAEVEFKQWQTEQATDRAERRVYGA